MPSEIKSGSRAFLIALAALVLITTAAFGLGLLLDTPALARLSVDANGAIAGIVATAPMLAFLFWFSKTTWSPLVAFRQSQIDFFANIGFEFTPLRIVVIAIGAGVSEELLFRGVLQTWVSGFAPIWAAIIATNIVFGALHARTVLYAIIAALVGVYLGVLLEVTDNLLAPLVAHALYDAIALDYTRRAITRSRSTRAGSGREFPP